MHSKKKLNEKFPEFNLSKLANFYGTAKNKAQKDFWISRVIAKVRMNSLTPTLADDLCENEKP